MVQLQVKNQTDNTPSFLDLGDVSIKADFSVLEIQDITKRKSENTQAFTLPFTQTNNNFFSHFYDVTATGDFNPNKKTEASILVDSIEVIEGYLQLLSVNTTSQTYEVIVYGLVANIVNQLSDSKLTDLDLSEFNHVLNETNVIDSWDGAITYTSGSTGDEILYPIIDYGYGYDKNIASSSDKILTCERLKPAIKIRTVFEKILNNIGYNSVSSDFKLTDFFTNQYMTLGTSSEFTNNAIEDSFRVGKTGNQTLTTTLQNLIFDRQTSATQFDFYDEGGNLDSNGFYTTQSDGYYRFKIRLNYTASGSSYHNVRIRMLLDDGVDPTYTDWTPQERVGSDVTGDAFIELYTDTTYIEDNTVVKFQASYLEANVGTFTVLASVSAEYKQSELELVQAPTSSIGSTVNFAAGNNIMPDITQIDFLKSILSRYNLVMVPSKFSSSLIVVEPIQDYFDDGVSKDWTDKIDNSKAITIKPTYEFQKDKIIFKDLDSEDFIGKEYQNVYGNPYNYYEVNIDSDFKQKGTNLELPSIFSSFITDRIVELGMSISRIYEINNNEIEKIDAKPKIFYYNGLKDCGGYHLWESLSSTTSTYKKEYPFCSHYIMAGDTIQETDTDIRFKSGYAVGEESLIHKQPKEDTFSKFWKQYLDNIFNKDARVLIGNFKLNSIDVANLKYNDKIFVKDSYYRVNKVSNYAFGKDVSTRVELIKILDFFDTLAIAGCDLRVSTNNLNGIVTFIDPTTGTTSSGNKVCCEANGFTWYGYTSNCVRKTRARINTKEPTAKTNRFNIDTTLGRTARKTKIKGDVTEFADSENATSGQVASWDATEGKVKWTGTRYAINCGFYHSTTSSVFLPFGYGGITDSTSSSGYLEYGGYVVPCDGYVDYVVVRGERAGGNSTVAFSKAPAGQEVPLLNPISGVSDLVNMSVDDTGFRFDNFKDQLNQPAFTFSAGDVIMFSLNTSSVLNDAVATAVLVFDWDNQL
jgi:hypothetical protein